jgi:D-alanine-D-alanine ligase
VVDKKFDRVAVLYGGTSSERDVSLNSGIAVHKALGSMGIHSLLFDTKDRSLSELVDLGVDAAIIMLHGKSGEDGTVQGALEMLGIPYTGSGVAACALAMDKWRTKIVLRGLGLATPDFVLIRDESDLAAASTRLGFPLFVKPAREGSTIGISKVSNENEFAAAVRLARGYDDLVIAEKSVNGAELTVAIVGNKTLPVVRIEAPNNNYDYEAKYISDETKYFCPSGLPDKLEEEIQSLGYSAFEAVGCRGWGRVDIMLDEFSRPWVLEVNTVPGMTNHSLVPKAALQSGISFEALVRRILETSDVA